jgi:autotransporter-associated beta strand protein
MKPWSIFRCVAVFVCCAAGLRAQNSTWTGLGLTDTEWSDPLNWDVVPGTTSNVFFSNLTPVVSDIDTNTTVSNVFIEGSVLGTLDLTSTNHSTLNASIYYETTQAAAISVAVTQNPGAVFAVNGGVLTLSNANNILSNVLILSGTLVDGVQGSISGTEGVSIDAPGILHVQYNESAGYLSDNTTGGGSVVLDPGVTLTLANNYTTTFSGVISGSGGIEKGANSTMTLTGANTYTGATVIDTGATIQLGNGGTTGSLSPFTTVSGGGTLSFSLASTTPLQETLSGSLNVVLQAGSGTVQLAGPNSYSGTTTVNAGILQAGSSTAFGNGFSAVSIPGSGALDLNGWDNAIGTLNLSATGSVTLDAGTLTIDSPGGTSFINGVISGSNGRVTTNSYQVIVTSENTYTGQTTIGGGTFEADNPSGGYANGQGSAQVLITPTGILQIGSGNANGFINPASPIIDNGTVTFVRADDITFSNNISGSGGLVKIATSDTVTLSGSNSFSGPIDLYSGTLKAGAGDTSAFGAGSEVKFDSSSSVLDLNNNAESVGSIYNGNASDSISLGSGHLTLTDNSASTNFAGIIQGTGGVTTSESQLALLGASTYSGGTIVLAGSLVADNAAGSATGTGDITILGGASLQIGSNDTKGAVSASTIMDAGTVVFDRTDSTTFSSNITGPGGILLSSPSPGSVELNGNNNYTGATDIENGGTLYAGSSSAFGSGSSDLTINNGGILVMSGHDLAFESITGDTSGARSRARAGCSRKGRAR